MSDRRSSNERVVYLDILRILATLAVVILHTAAWHWHTTDIQSVVVLHAPAAGPHMTDFHSYQWNCFNVWDSTVRWSVPMFVMISGALFLNPNRMLSIRKLYSKNILRIVTAFLFWSAVYAIYTWHMTPGMLRQDLFVAFAQGHFHMWYLFMIVGLYFITPLLRIITNNKKGVRYFLAISFIFAVAVPSAESLVNAVLTIYPEPHLALVSEVFAGDIASMSLSFVMGYSFYYVLGYYLSVHSFSRKKRHGLYILSLVGFVLTPLLTAVFSAKSGAANESFYDFFSITVLLEAIGVFELFKSCKFSLPENTKKHIANIANMTFGVYLVHMLVIEVLADRFSITSLLFNPAISVPVLATAVFFVGMAISAVLHQIPILREYVV